MKIRIDMEIDLQSGAYDVRFHNLTRPGEDIDVPQVTSIMHRVLDSVAVKTHTESMPQGSEWTKLDLN